MELVVCGNGIGVLWKFGRSVYYAWQGCSSLSPRTAYRVREGSVRKGVVRKGGVRKGGVREGGVREGGVREGGVREDGECERRS